MVVLKHKVDDDRSLRLFYRRSIIWRSQPALRPPHTNGFNPTYMLLYKCKFLQFNETECMYLCMCLTQNSVHAQLVHTHAGANAALRDQIVMWLLASDAAFSPLVLWQSTSHLPGRTSAELVLALVLLRLQRDPVRDDIFALSCQLWN